MACRTPAENAVDTPATILANKKILELKKKLLLAEGQKKAYVGEWTQRLKQNSDAVSELKKEIKELTGKLSFLNNDNIRPYAKDPPPVVRKQLPYPPGAKTAEQAVHITDLKVIDLTKQLDLLNEKYGKRKAFFDQIYEQYQDLLADKNETSEAIEPAPSTIEEDENRKLICHLENEIHRTNVQWMEAEHIRKKYRSIKASLMADAEKFEKSLLELERAIVEQQSDIKRMQEINQEAIQMRDATKIVLLRQEHAAHVSTKSRDRQAFDFRRQVEERKVELERLERKLFSTGKTLLHQGSVESLSGEQQSGKKVVKQDSNDQVQAMTGEMEMLFKKLMEVTGATTPLEVLDRFITQKESTTRLNYLRTVTEAEKKHLEMQREVLAQQLEATKFSDVKETEENQEQLEQLKQSIADEINQANEYIQASEQTVSVIDYIKSTLLDLILKLQEVDEAIDPSDSKSNREDDPFELADLLSGNVTNEQLLQILEDKIKKGLISSGQMMDKDAVGISDEDIDTSPRLDDLHVPIPQSTPSPTPRPASVLDDRERPQAYPSCYNNLMTGRATGLLSAPSPGQANQPVATDDEGDVPTRGYLKRQAQYIVDAKSRRKGFRPARR